MRRGPYTQCTSISIDISNDMCVFFRNSVSLVTQQRPRMPCAAPMSATIITLSGGAWIFLAFAIIMFIALVQGSYTRGGSGIDHHPYGRRYTDAPGARRKPQISGREGIARMSSRG